jgi:hypothetical protein
VRQNFERFFDLLLRRTPPVPLDQLHRDQGFPVVKLSPGVFSLPICFFSSCPHLVLLARFFALRWLDDGDN